MDKQELTAQLKKLFPNGDPGFIPMFVDLMQLHSDKNFEYAHGGDALGNFNRVAGILAQYPNLKLADPSVVCLVYMQAVFYLYIPGLPIRTMNPSS